MRRSSTTKTFERVYQAIVAFDISDVKRSYMKRCGLDQATADRHEQELKRYLTLCVLNPGTPYGMFSDIDDFWHEFICFTIKYHRFCQVVAGYYIHHTPTGSDADSERQVSEGQSPRQNTIRDYEKLFGKMDPSIWPVRADNCRPGSSCTVDCYDPCTSDRNHHIGPAESVIH